MENEFGGKFPVPQIFLGRLESEWIESLEQERSNSDSAGEELRETVSKRPVCGTPYLKNAYTLKKHFFGKRKLSTAKLSSEEREGSIIEYSERASSKSRAKQRSNCVAESCTASLPPKKMPRQKLTMDSQVDMFAQSPPLKDEGMVKDEEGTPKKNCAACSKTEDAIPESLRRSSRIKNQVVSSASEFKAPIGLRVNPKLNTAKKVEQADDKISSSDPKPKVYDGSNNQREDGKELQLTSNAEFTDSDDDVELRIDVSPLVKSLDTEVSESKNSSNGRKTKKNSPSVEGGFQNKSPKKGLTKESREVSPDKSRLGNFTETDVIPSLVQPFDVVFTSEPAAGHCSGTFKASNEEIRRKEATQEATRTQNGNSLRHNSGGDGSGGGVSRSRSKVSSPFQCMRKSYEQSPVHETSYIAQEVRNISPKKTPLKDDSVRKSLAKSSDDSGIVARSGNATDSRNSSHSQKDVSESRPKLEGSVSDCDSENEEGLSDASSSTYSEDEKVANDVDSKNSVPSKNPVIGKKKHPDSSDSESESNAPDKHEALKSLQTSCSLNQPSKNRPGIPAEKDGAKAIDSDSSDSSTEHDIQAERKFENLRNKSDAAISEKERSDGSHNDTNSSDGDELHFDRLGPSATSTQKIPLPNKTTNSESNSSEADVRQSAERMGGKNPVLPSKSGALTAKKPLTDDNDAESESCDSEEGNTTNAGELSSTLAEVKLKRKESSSGSGSESSDSDRENGSKRILHSGTAAISSQGRTVPKKEINLNTGSSQSEGEEFVNALQSNATARRAPQIPKPEITSRSNSGTDSDESSGGKKGKEAEKKVSSQGAVAVKVNNGSSYDSDSSRSEDEKFVKALNSPAMAAQAPLLKNASKQSRSSDTESDSSQFRDETTVKPRHSSVTASRAPQIKSLPRSSESSDSESDSGESGDEKMAQVSGKDISVEAERQDSDSRDLDFVNIAKVSAALDQSHKQSSISRVSKKSSSDSESTDSEKQKTNSLSTKIEPKNSGSGGESRKQAVKRSSEQESGSSDSDSNSTGPDQSTVDSKINIKPMENLKALPSIVHSTDDTASVGNVKGNPIYVHKGPQSSDNSSSSDDTPVHKEKPLSKQSIGLFDTVAPLKRKASESSSSDSNSLQPKAKLQKLCSPVNHPSRNVAASNHSSSSSSSGESDSETAQKRNKNSREKSLADVSKRSEISVSRKRKADSVSSSDSSDSEPKNEQRRVESPVTPVAQQSHPVNSTARAGDIEPVFPGSDISVITKPGSTPSKVNPSKSTSQRSILEFAKPRAPVSSTPELPQKNVRNKLDLLKSDYLNSGYRDVGDQFDFDSIHGLFEEDLLKNDVKVYVVQCPKEVDPESLVGQKIDLSQKESMIKLTDKCGEKVPYEVHCGFSDSDVGVSLITPSKRRKKFTLTSVPVAGRITIAETLNVPAVREVASTSPHRVPFPENLKPRNPFIGTDDDYTAQEILKKIKQKNRKGQHDFSAPSSALPESQPTAKTLEKKQKAKARPTAELLPPPTGDYLPKPSTKPERAVPKESSDDTSDGVKNKKKKKKDKSSEDVPPVLKAESKDELSSSTTESLHHKPLAGQPEIFSESTPKKGKETKKRDKEERSKYVPSSPVSFTATDDPQRSIPGEERFSDATSEKKNKKKKKKKKDKSCKDPPPVVDAESEPQEFSNKEREGLRPNDLGGQANPPSVKTGKKKKDRASKESPAIFEAKPHLKEEYCAPTSELLENSSLAGESDVTSDKKMKKKRKKEKKRLKEELPNIKTEHFPYQDLLHADSLPTIDPDVTSSKKKKKKKREEIDSPENAVPHFITQTSRDEKERVQPLDPSNVMEDTSESDVTSDKKMKKKRKKEKKRLKEELPNIKTEHFPYQDLLHADRLPTIDSDVTYSKKKKKKHQEMGLPENAVPHFITQTSREEKERVQPSDPSNVMEDTSGPTVAKKKKKKHRDQ